MANKEYLVVEKIIAYQALIILLTIASVSLLSGIENGISAALGGAAAFFPNVYFAFKVRSKEGQQVKKIVRSFYTAEAGKLILTAALFVMIFQVPGLKILPLMLSYLMALSVFWFALLMR